MREPRLWTEDERDPAAVMRGGVATKPRRPPDQRWFRVGMASSVAASVARMDRDDVGAIGAEAG